jgi:hypothetical protein
LSEILVIRKSEDAFIGYTSKRFLPFGHRHRLDADCRGSGATPGLFTGKVAASLLDQLPSFSIFSRAMFY